MPIDNAVRDGEGWYPGMVKDLAPGAELWAGEDGPISGGEDGTCGGKYPNGTKEHVLFFWGGVVFLFADVIIFVIIFEDNGGVRGWAKHLLGVPLEVSLCFVFIKKKRFHFAFYFKVVLLICAQF